MDEQKRRWMAPQEAVSPKMDLRQAPISASGPAQRMPDNHGGNTSAVGTSSRTDPVKKPISRHAISAVFCKDTLSTPCIMKWLLCPFTPNKSSQTGEINCTSVVSQATPIRGNLTVNKKREQHVHFNQVKLMPGHAGIEHSMA